MLLLPKFYDLFKDCIYYKDTWVKYKYNYLKYRYALLKYRHS